MLCYASVATGILLVLFLLYTAAQNNRAAPVGSNQSCTDRCLDIYKLGCLNCSAEVNQCHHTYDLPYCSCQSCNKLINISTLSQPARSKIYHFFQGLTRYGSSATAPPGPPMDFHAPKGKGQLSA